MALPCGDPVKLHNPFARHTGRHVPRPGIPGTMLQPVRFNDERDDRLRTARLVPADESEDDWGEPDEDDGRCVHCGADVGHYNGCTEDPDAMCLCHLCMGEQAVTSEAECPYHGRPDRLSWRERLANGVSALIGATARGLAWLIGGEEEMPVDDNGEPLSDLFIGPVGPVCPNCGRTPGGSVCQACGYGYGYQPAYEAQVTAVYEPGRLPVTDPVPVDDTITDWAPRNTARRQARNIWGPPAPESRWDYLARTGVPESLAYVAEILAAPFPQVKALTAA